MGGGDDEVHFKAICALIIRFKMMYILYSCFVEAIATAFIFFKTDIPGDDGKKRHSSCLWLVVAEAVAQRCGFHVAFLS
jgi:hypothetical protein